MSKSYVTMEQHQCFICLKSYDTGAILLNRHLRPMFESKTVTGRDPCPECAQHLGAGFVALVEASQERGEMKRSGVYGFIKEAVWPFDVPVPAGRICYVEPGVFTKLESMKAPT